MVWPATAVPLTNVEKNAHELFAFSLFHSMSLVTPPPTSTSTNALSHSQPDSSVWIR